MNSPYLWDRIAARDLSLRAGDADRERIADRLRKAHAEGRVDIAEFQQRLDRCYAAKTFGELRELVSDLPRAAEHDRQRPAAWLRVWRWRGLPLAPVVIALIAISAASEHHHHVFWVWIPLAFLFWRMSWWRRMRWPGGRDHGPGDWI